MREWRVTAQRLLIIGMMVAAHTAGIIAVAQNQQPELCSECVEEFVGTAACGAGAGIECGHGAENDPDCVSAALAAIAANPQLAQDADALFAVICSELNGGNGNCSCFECGIVDECEGYAADFLAWCGIQGPNQDGDCDTHTDEVDPPETIRYEYDATIVDGGPCNSNQGFTTLAVR